MTKAHSEEETEYGKLIREEQEDEQDETRRKTESTPPPRLKGGYWGVFVSPLSLGSKASLDCDQASSHEVQSIPTHTRESGAILVFYVCLGNIKEKKSSSSHKGVYKRGVVLTHYRFSATSLEDRRGAPAASRDWYVLSEACKAHLQPWVRNS